MKMAPSTANESDVDVGRKAAFKKKIREDGEVFDESFGYQRFCVSNGNKESRRGWIFNMISTTVPLANANAGTSDFSATVPERAGLDLYFLAIDGSTFKATIFHDPYFYVVPKTPSFSASGINRQDQEEHSIFYETLVSTLMRSFESRGLKAVEILKKVDLDASNHLGSHGSKGQTMLKLVFNTVQQLMDVRNTIQSKVISNQKREKDRENTRLFGPSHLAYQQNPEPLESLIDIREYDVPYVVRVCIDLNIRSGAWYTVTPHHHDIGVTLSNQDVEKKANPTFLAFDIECTKAPLKFPDANVDSIFMISYMVNGQGYLIISRHAVGADVSDFEYTPKPSCPGPFKVFNELTEKDLIHRFLDEFVRVRPQIVVTYNGDFFDWPFLEQRAAVYGLNLRSLIGIEHSGGDEEAEYRGRCCVHLDAFKWVQRDSYLPQGSQGLKAVTKYKMGYDPVEVEPEEMVRYARERPVHMATYSVSDAVATYYLYEKYVHMFIFSLCTIIPMAPEDVLRKGSGTLCEALLMVQACAKNIICPNKQNDPNAKFYEGHLLESETYVGGKVECLETGVYRSDLEYSFELVPQAFHELINSIDRDLKFAIQVETGLDPSKVTNYDEVRSQIIGKLELLRDRPTRMEKPNIYHLDVGAMYPNIILTNRLQPYAVVDDSKCAACDFNLSKNNCKRKMNWIWRGEYNPSTKGEYEQAKESLAREKFADGRSFISMPDKEQALLISNRLKQYAKNAYKKVKVTEEICRTDTVCMRENDFYINTVREFRDRRYEYKRLTKKWGQMVGAATDPLSRKEAEDKSIVYDSLQVAHKCILNSFYGYVMRKGARWRSMEMAGIVTKTGSDIITQARKLVEQVGRPLELDTDGIWCILPQSFPTSFVFHFQDGTKMKLEYPCTILNADIHQSFTNHQYQNLKDPSKRIYETKSECSIFFELDGPHRCMVLPASTDEGRLLKKRYAVFNTDGTLGELKGFELKRRGELELIKTFQSQVFERFLNGSSLVECYESVAEVANNWIDILDTQGGPLDTDELMDLICENRSMSKHLEDYGDQKGTSQTTARRLGEFLGADFIKDKGLNCRFVIADYPHGAPVTDRAIPTVIWKAEPAVRCFYLRKWLNMPGLQDEDLDVRKILDWNYYKERLGKTIQRIITIPAALQNIANPVPRIAHPEWLQKEVRRKNDRFQQQSIKDAFSLSLPRIAAPIGNHPNTEKHLDDIEDMTVRMGLQAGIPIVRRLKNGVQKDHKNEPHVNSIRSTPEFNRMMTKVSLTSDNFQLWLSTKKNQWNFKSLKKRPLHTSSNLLSDGGKQSDTTTSKKSRRNFGDIEGFIRDASLALTQHELHILEIREVMGNDTSANGINSRGQFIVWVLLPTGNLQKLQITVPRIFFINSRTPLRESSSTYATVKKVERHLPHSQTAKYLYEVQLSESDFRSGLWIEKIFSADEIAAMDSFYELDTPLIFRSLLELGCVARIRPQAAARTNKVDIFDLKRIDKPVEGQYLHRSMSYRRLFFYETLHSRSKIGLVGLFILDGDDSYSTNEGYDVTEPHNSDPGSFELKVTCHMWIVKPGAEKGQRNISKRRCDEIFSDLIREIVDTANIGGSSEYACLSAKSVCQVRSLSFVDRDKDAYVGLQDVLNTYLQGNNGPTIMLMNSVKNSNLLRKIVPSFSSFPLVHMTFPPGLDHNPSTSSLPSLNWEPQAVHLCFEALLYLGLVSFPEKVSYARFGNVPLGNLGLDSAVMVFDISLSRQLQKNRSLLWISEHAGHPDVGHGSSYFSSDNRTAGALDVSSVDRSLDINEIWGDDSSSWNEAIRYPGAHQSICVEINIYNLAVAALTDIDALPASVVSASFTQLGKSSDTNASILGDEMSTALSLSILQSLIQSWLREALDQNVVCADKLLSNLYRLISSRESTLSDPALHRVMLNLMKSTFHRLLGEFERLGSKVIYADFTRMIVATNKTSFHDGKEYLDFLLSTITKNQERRGNAHLSLSPNHFYCNFLFLDENNFSGIRYEIREPDDGDEAEWVFPLEVENGSLASIVPTYVSGWNMCFYLPEDVPQEYFLGAISRLIKETYRYQIELDAEDEDRYFESVRRHKNGLISNSLSEYLTKAVAELMSEGLDPAPEKFPRLPGSHLNFTIPVLEFVKNVLVVLELDTDTEGAVHILKKSLLAQVGLEEYATEMKWINPCASFILRDVFCRKCYQCRDVDLCVFSQLEEMNKLEWLCADCQEPYDPEYIELRLIQRIEQNCIRYQLQDLRCSKTQVLSTRLLSRLSIYAENLKTDISRDETYREIRILRNLAEYYRLEWLHETCGRLMHGL